MGTGNEWPEASAYRSHVDRLVGGEGGEFVGGVLPRFGRADEEGEGFAVEDLRLEERLGDLVEVAAVIAEELDGAVLGFAEEALDLLIHREGGFFAVVSLVVELSAEAEGPLDMLRAAHQLNPDVIPPPGAEVRAALAAETRGAMPVGVTAPRPGRNEQCPCGSGVKFKKCHGAS